MLPTMQRTSVSQKKSRTGVLFVLTMRGTLPRFHWTFWEEATAGRMSRNENRRCFLGGGVCGFEIKEVKMWQEHPLLFSSTQKGSFLAAMFSRICPSEMGGRRHHVILIRSPFSFPLSGEEGGELFLFIFYEIDSPSFLLLLPSLVHFGAVIVTWTSRREGGEEREIFFGGGYYEGKGEKWDIIYRVPIFWIGTNFRNTQKSFLGLSHPPYIYLDKNRDLRQSASLTTWPPATPPSNPLAGRVVLERALWVN